MLITGHMTRPKFCRKILCKPGAAYFKPGGIPSSLLEETVITLDEFEALRLADYEGLYHEQAARMMNISRQTFGRIIISAREKVAEALVHGKALKIEGGIVSRDENGELRCPDCSFASEICMNSDAVPECPACRKRLNFNKMEKSL